MSFQRPCVVTELARAGKGAYAKCLTRETYDEFAPIREELDRDLLARDYGWTTKGFDTPDLKAPMTMLGELF